MVNEGGKWKGRAEKISDLELENSRLKKLVDSGDHSNKMFESRLNSPDIEPTNFSMQPRDNGDGSSRQESFSRQDEPGSTPSLTPIKISSNASQRDMAIKLHEYRIICQVLKLLKSDEEIKSRLSRCSTARGSSTRLSLVGPTKVRACKPFLFAYSGGC